ncbi:MAG: hypothetical protein ABIG55_07055 [Candidatus Omnitrophota bacterium]
MKHLYMMVVVMAAVGALICADPFASAGEKAKTKYKMSKHGLEAMIELSQSRDYMVRELNVETENYEKIRKGILSERLKQGSLSEEIRKEYGEPVIDLEDDDGSLRWVYKPANETFSSKEKVYLIFDSEDKLLSWKCLSE